MEKWDTIDMDELKEYIRRFPFRCGFIYVVREKQTGIVKIGFSRNPIQRFVNLKHQVEKVLQAFLTFFNVKPVLEFVACVAASKEAEWFIKRILQEEEIAGEWYRPSPIVHAVIAALWALQVNECILDIYTIMDSVDFEIKHTERGKELITENTGEFADITTFKLTLPDDSTVRAQEWVTIEDAAQRLQVLPEIIHIAVQKGKIDKLTIINWEQAQYWYRYFSSKRKSQAKQGENFEERQRGCQGGDLNGRPRSYAQQGGALSVNSEGSEV